MAEQMVIRTPLGNTTIGLGTTSSSGVSVSVSNIRQEIRQLAKEITRAEKKPRKKMTSKHEPRE